MPPSRLLYPAHVRPHVVARDHGTVKAHEQEVLRPPPMNFSHSANPPTRIENMMLNTKNDRLRFGVVEWDTKTYGSF
jgi:hypothetical protein